MIDASTNLYNEDTTYSAGYSCTLHFNAYLGSNETLGAAAAITLEPQVAIPNQQANFGSISIHDAQVVLGSDSDQLALRSEHEWVQYRQRAKYGTPCDPGWRSRYRTIPYRTQSVLLIVVSSIPRCAAKPWLVRYSAFDRTVAATK